LRQALLGWYDLHRRELPWRGSTNPYHVWLSEIMLQQTRVAVVLERYGAFRKRFPTLAKLAAAKPESVLAAWSGLGYYRRARALHRAARQIVAARKGRVPRTLDELRELPGVGRYTAAAIASIAFQLPVAAVDGNVKRVLSRMFLSPARVDAGSRRTPADLHALAELLLEPSRPGDWNQAVMDLGAMVCLPRRPLCDLCPLKRWCRWQRGSQPKQRRLTSQASGEISRQGQKLNLPAAPRRKREVSYGLALRSRSVYLVRRPPAISLMPGMWELPELEPPPPGRSPRFRLRHAITTTDYKVSVFAIDKEAAASSTKAYPLPRGGRWVSVKRIAGLPLTGLARKILHRAEVI
jgi:A/G-specific adenine glycosylase